MKGSKRIICILTAILIASAFTACKKGDSIQYTSPSSVLTGESASTTSPQPTTPATTAAVPAGDISVGWCNDNGVNIRAGAGTDYYAIGALYSGDKVNVLGKEGDWYKIRYSKGKDGVGYVNAQYISATEVVKTATSSTASATTATTAAQ